MGKTKRKAKITVFGSVEGYREKYFLDFLKEIYEPRKHNINPTFDEPSGGTPDKLVGQAFQHDHFSRTFVWLDEDFEPEYPLCDELRKKLAISWKVDEEKLNALLNCPLKDLESRFNLEKRKPRLIVSQPVCVESIILKILDKSLPYEQYDPAKRKEQIKRLKNCVNGIVGSNEAQFYQEHLTKEKIEEKRKNIPVLDILISMIT